MGIPDEQDRALAHSQAAGLRLLADIIETNGQLAQSSRWNLHRILIAVTSEQEINEWVTACTRFALPVHRITDELMSGVDIKLNDDVWLRVFRVTGTGPVVSVRAAAEVPA